LTDDTVLIDLTKENEVNKMITCTTYAKRLAWTMLRLVASKSVTRYSSIR
jgi:hypothetical protein